MAEFDVKLDGVEELMRRFKAAPGTFASYMRGFLTRAVVVVERRVKEIITEKKVNNTGALRSSVAHEVNGSGAQMEGVIGSPLAYAVFVEEDTKAHWPPRRPIIFWAMRKLQLSGSELMAAVRGIQRKIAARGTTGRHMFAEGLAESDSQIEGLWAQTWGEAVTKEL